MRRGEDRGADSLAAAEIAPGKAAVARRRRNPADDRDEIEPGRREHRLEAVDIRDVGDIAGKLVHAGAIVIGSFGVTRGRRGLRFSDQPDAAVPAGLDQIVRRGAGIGALGYCARSDSPARAKRGNLA